MELESEEEKLELEKRRYIDTLIEIKNKSDDDYEKNVTFISSGTLLLSITFIEKIISINKSNSIWTLILSWIFLCLTLVINLFSHQLSSWYHEKSIEEYDYDITNEIVRKRNKEIRYINWGTTFLLILGMIFLIIFCSINAIHMSKENNNSEENNNSSYFEKGRTMTLPIRREVLSKPSDSTSNSQVSQQNSGNEASSGNKDK